MNRESEEKWKNTTTKLILKKKNNTDNHKDV